MRFIIAHGIHLATKNQLAELDKTVFLTDSLYIKSISQCKLLKEHQSRLSAQFVAWKGL